MHSGVVQLEGIRMKKAQTQKSVLLEEIKGGGGTAQTQREVELEETRNKRSRHREKPSSQKYGMEEADTQDISSARERRTDTVRTSA